MTTAKTLIIGSRGSRLAMIQAEWVRDRIRERYPQLKIKIQKIKTSGDVRQDQPVGAQGRKGLYTSEIEIELQEGRIDCAVHSMKDMPSQIDPAFKIIAVTKREDPRDVLVCQKYSGFFDLPRDARIGTSSLRRMTQIKNFRPDLQVVPIRGNVETRLKKLKSEGLEALMLAAAGLIRLGLEKTITEYLEPSVILPAAGQGALGIEIRADDDERSRQLSFLNDTISAVAVRAERACIRELSGGCDVPITAFARSEGNRLEVMGLVASPDGRELLRDQVEGHIQRPEAAGLELAKSLMNQGAERLIKQIHAYVRKR